MDKEEIKTNLVMAEGYLIGIKSAARIEKEAFNGHALTSINSYIKIIDMVIDYIKRAKEELENE